MMYVIIGGNTVLKPEFNASPEFFHQRQIMEDQYQWEREFWDKVKQARMNEIPMPIMVGNKPFWRGVNPPRNVIIPDGCIYVADFKCKIWRVRYNNTRLPTDQEYIKYFKRDIDGNTYFLKMCKGDDFMTVLEKTARSRKKKK